MYIARKAVSVHFDLI